MEVLKSVLISIAYLRTLATIHAFAMVYPVKLHDNLENVRLKTVPDNTGGSRVLPG